MTKLFTEYDEKEKYWTTKSDWQNFRKQNQPVIQKMEPIQPKELVYIKLIQSKKEDGMPLNTLYVRRDGNNVNDKQYADLFTLKSAQEYVERHPESVSQDGQYTFRYEIESLRPY